MYTYTNESPYGPSSTNMYSQPTSTAGGQIPVMTWNLPQQQQQHHHHLYQQQQQAPNSSQHHYHSQHPQQHRMRSSVQLEKQVVAPQQQQQPHYDNSMVTPRPHSFPVMPVQTPLMATQHHHQQVSAPAGAAPLSTQQQHQSQQEQRQQQTKLTTSFWEDEGTICYQVDAKGVCVARRQDNDMVNGTKLLNVVGMSRGKRDGILKNERGRVVVKVGAMHLKGVWITISRAKALAAQYNIADLLHPLFADDPAIFFYAAPPPPPPMLSMPPGYYYPHAQFGPPPPPPPYLRQQHHPHHHHTNVMETDAVTRAPSIPSMAPSTLVSPAPPPPITPVSSIYNYSTQDFFNMDQDRSQQQDQQQQQQQSPQPQFPTTNLPFEMENISGTSLVDYASRAGGSSSMLSGITATSDSAPTTPGSQQYHSQLHMMHSYDNSTATPNTSSTALSFMEPTSNASHILNDNSSNQMVDEFGRPVNMFISPYHDQRQQQLQDTKWYSNLLPHHSHNQQQQQPW
ncbi:hypothetical protein INT45_005730 [Circinella minor]|uniref:HTH APSES-type domain-containing protein n=1 Tax=Circinella minor TaxID=1195481 RepID=A0A8H7SC28_9FUNG|nr:hypothetical protein INT45_005730 [Circinella minor]